MLKSYHRTYSCVLGATRPGVSLEKAIESGNQKCSPLFPCGKDVATEKAKRDIIQNILLKMASEYFTENNQVSGE